MHELRVRCGALGRDHEAHRLHALPDLGRGHDLLQRRLELVDDGLRRAADRRDARPAQRLEAREAALGDRRQVRVQRVALQAGDGQRAQLAGLDVRQRRGDVVEHHVDLASQQILVGRCAAAVGHVLRLAAHGGVERCQRGLGLHRAAEEEALEGQQRGEEPEDHERGRQGEGRGGVAGGAPVVTQFRVVPVAGHDGMLLNRPDVVQTTLRNLVRGPAVASIRVYDKKGAIVMSGGTTGLEVEATSTEELITIAAGIGVADHDVLPHPGLEIAALEVRPLIGVREEALRTVDVIGGVPGVKAANVVVIGGGIAGTHAVRIALGMEAIVTVIDKNPDRLRALDELFGAGLNTIYSTVDSIEQYVINADLVIGAVLVPGATAPKLVTRKMIKRMRPGSVVIDIAIDQGGCFETSRATTHADPVYVVDGVTHYCVANMPGSVARTSTFALNNATLPFAVALANKGVRQACVDDSHLMNGLNIHAGQITCQAVADSLKLKYTPARQALGI